MEIFVSIRVIRDKTLEIFMQSRNTQIPRKEIPEIFVRIRVIRDKK